MTHACRGSCFEQVDLNDHKKRDRVTCDCTLQPCLNIELCGNLLPEWVLDCHMGRCVSCNIFFAQKIEIKDVDDEECCYCLENVKRMVKFPNCIHMICVACFKDIYFNSEEMEEVASKCPLCRRAIFKQW